MIFKPNKHDDNLYNTLLVYLETYFIKNFCTDTFETRIYQCLFTFQ